MSGDVNGQAKEPQRSVAGRTIIGAGWLVGWRMTTRMLGLISMLVLARLLVPADFGLVAMATAFSASVLALSELGVSDALIRRDENDRGHYDTAFTMQAIRGCLTGLVIAAAAWSAGEWFNEPRLFSLMLVLAALAVINGFENIGIVEFRRSLRFDVEFRLLLLPRVSAFFTTIAMAWLLRSFWALLIGMMVSTVLRFVMTYVVHPFRPRFTLSHWRDLVGFSFWAWATSMASLLWDRLDTFVLGPVVGPSKLGVYLLSAEVAVMPVTELVGPASSALFPGLSMARPRGADLVGMTISVISAMLLLVVPLTIGVSATSGYVIAALLGAKWEEARPLIAILVWLCVLAPFSFVCMTVMKALGTMRQLFFAIASAAAFKALALFFVVQAGAHLETAAYAAVLCTALECGLFLLILRRHGDMVWRANAGGLSRIAASGLLVTGVMVMSGLGWQPVVLSSIPALLIGGSIGVVVIILFAIIQAMLWLAVGRPQGPEQRVLSLLSETFAPRMRRIVNLTGG